MSTVNHAPVGSDPTSVVPVSNASSSSAPKLICSFIYVRIEGHLSRWVPSPTTPRGSEIITGPPTKLFFLPPGIRDCIGDSLPVFHDSIGYFCLSCTFFGSIIPYSKHTRLYQAALSALHARELRVRKPEPEGQWDEFRRILQKDSKAPCTPRYIRWHRLNADMRSSCLHTLDSPSSAATGASSSSRRDTSYTI